MKPVKLLVLLTLVLLSCRKDEDLTFRVYGSLKDANTQAPLSGVPIVAYSSDGDFNAAWNGTLTVVVRGQVKTDANGNFDFEFAKTKYETIAYLGCTQIPSGYQPDALLNGAPVSLYLDVDDFYANPQRAVITDATFSNILLKAK